MIRIDRIITLKIIQNMNIDNISSKVIEDKEKIKVKMKG